MKVESAHGLKVQEEQDIDLIKIILKPRSSVNMRVSVCVGGCSMAIIRRS